MDDRRERRMSLQSRLGPTDVWETTCRCPDVHQCSMLETERTQCIGYYPTTEWSRSRWTLDTRIDKLFLTNHQKMFECSRSRKVRWWTTVTLRCVRIALKYLLREWRDPAHNFPLILRQKALRVCFRRTRPTFSQLLEELAGKPYMAPIQRSLQLTLFNGVTPVLDHNLDLSDFKVLDSS